MKNLQKTVVLSPTTGSKNASETFGLNGYVTAMVVYTRGTENVLTGTETVNPLIFMGLKDDANGDIVPKIHIQHFFQTGGPYKDSFKPLGFHSNNKNFVLELETERASVGNVSKDIEVYVTFFYGQEPKKHHEHSLFQNPVPARPMTTARPLPVQTRQAAPTPMEMNPRRR